SGSDPNQNKYMLSSCVMKSMRYGLTLALQTDAYFEFYPYNTHTANWWYDEYDGGTGIRKRGYLGKPTGASKLLTNGVYRRDFDNGIALNNPTSASQTVALETTYKHLQGTQNPTLNDGSSTTKVTIPARDGVILLRSAATLKVSSSSPTNGSTVSGKV